MVNSKEIDFMGKKDMSNETINKILRYDSYHVNETDLLERLTNIYELLGFIGLSNYDIEKIIFLNQSILDFSVAELCKLAAVLEGININNEITDSNTLARGIVNYKRVFMRNLVATQAGRDTYRNGLSFLTSSDNQTYGGKYSLSGNVFSIFKTYCESDEELEQLLNHNLKIKDNYYSVDDYIKIQSSIFYRRYLQNKKNIEGKTPGSL